MGENNTADSIPEIDEIADFVEREGITSEYVRVNIRPDVSLSEQELWRSQDPEFPPEHYRCTIRCGGKELTVYQTVGADYPDEDEEADNSDLYRESRELLLSTEFLIESAALKANSVEDVADVEEWALAGYCETTTPTETFALFIQIREDLLSLLGEQRYQALVELALDADLARVEDMDDEGELEL